MPKRALLVIEFKGFTEMATVLAEGAASAGVTPELVRASGIEIVDQVLTCARAASLPLQMKHIGGDSWFLEFEDLEEAVRFGVTFLHRLSAMTKSGIFFLKPSLAIGVGVTKWKGGRPIDNTSITGYKIADKGDPFRLIVFGPEAAVVKSWTWVTTEDWQSRDSAGASILWQYAGIEEQADPGRPLDLPATLIDGEMLYVTNTEDTIRSIVKRQAQSTEVYAFGGPIPLTGHYRQYLLETVRLLRSPWKGRITLLTYLIAKEALVARCWIELCRQLTALHPDKLSFAAYLLPKGHPRPTAFHLYDDLVYFGLRSYHPHLKRSTMSGGVMFRHSRIASHFRDDFLEKWREVGPSTEKSLLSLSRRLSTTSPPDAQSVSRSVEGLLKEAEADTH
jgi:hypothetical protein